MTPDPVGNPQGCQLCGCIAEPGHRFCPMCGSALLAAPVLPETRRNVAVLFADLVDSTVLGELLDPEPLRSVLDRYFAICAACITEHLGVVEKYIGDAVMAVFGVLAAHEDDVLRAAHAAMAMLDAVERLNVELAATDRIRLELRIGICAGEVVVASSPAGNLRVVGDTVNTAARLQAAARPGQVLVGGHAALIARDRLLLEPLKPLTLKGKQDKVPVWALTSVDPSRGAGFVAPTETPMVDREEELAELEQIYRRSSALRQSCLITVLGSPGLGKSRLVREFLDRRTAEEAEVLIGHCRSYRRGVTYQPLEQMLKSVGGGWPVLADLLGGTSGGNRSLRCLAALTGRTAALDAVPAGVEEISAAVCCLVETLARNRPMILVWEDLHWAEPTLLDLIDRLATWLTDVPVLQICVARPELLSIRSTWGGGKPCAATLELGPLTETDTTALVYELATRGEVVAQQDTQLAHRRVVDSCDGNPLFAELLWEVTAASGSGTAVPPTIQTLLGARIDLLQSGERDLLERAAVIGRDFTLAQLGGLDAVPGPAEAAGMAEAGMAGSSDPADLPSGQPAETDDATIRQLIRQRLLQRTDQGYRFGQSMLRDTVYGLTPKTRREYLHVRMAGQAERRRPAPEATGVLAELPLSPDGEADRAAVIGYHLEAACLLGRQLRPGDDRLTTQARRAARLLITQGTRALQRRDLPAAAALLERGREMLPAGDPDHVPLAMQISDCHIALWAITESLTALTICEQLSPDDGRGRRTAEIQRLLISAQAGLAPLAEIGSKLQALEEALRADQDDDLGWCRFYQLRAFLDTFAERIGAAESALQQALGRCRSMASRYEEDRILAGLCELALWGPTDVAASLALCAEVADRFSGNRVQLVPVLLARAGLLALTGEITDARALLETAQRYVSDLRLTLAAMTVSQVAGLVESVAGASAAAEAHYLAGAVMLRDVGQVPAAQTLEACAARELLAQGKSAAARAALAVLTQDGTDGDVRTGLIAAATTARLAAADQNSQLAEAAGLHAWDLVGLTDDLRLRGDALWDIARASLEFGDQELASRAATRAAECYRQKGATMLSEQVDDWARSVGIDGAPGRPRETR
jgi:class 3 adenylate cyclase